MYCTGIIVAIKYVRLRRVLGNSNYESLGSTVICPLSPEITLPTCHHKSKSSTASGLIFAWHVPREFQATAVQTVEPR